MGKIDRLKVLGYTYYDMGDSAFIFKDESKQPDWLEMWGNCAKSVKIIHKNHSYLLVDYINKCGIVTLKNDDIVSFKIIRNKSAAIAIELITDTLEGILLYSDKAFRFCGLAVLVGNDKVIFCNYINGKKIICLYNSSTGHIYEMPLNNNGVELIIYSIDLISDFKYLINNSIIIDFENGNQKESKGTCNYVNIEKSEYSDVYLIDWSE